MTTGTARPHTSDLPSDRLRTTGPQRHLIIARIVAGVPLLLTGLAQALVPEADLRALMDAAGFPFAAVIAPIGIAVKIVAGALLLLGAWARLAGAAAVPIMLAALYAHAVIDAWPGGPELEPPLVAPIAVLLGGAYVAWRGAGRWSLDRRRATAAATG